jgi:hypothetical protein
LVIADAFSLRYGMLDRTTELDIGEWLFVSYKATKQRNLKNNTAELGNDRLFAKGS